MSVGNKHSRFLVRAFAMLLSCAAISAGHAQSNMQDAFSVAQKAAQARQANAALMHQYTWNSRVEIVVNGNVKDTKIEAVSYAPSGQLQHTVLNDQQASSGFYLPTPIGFLRRAIADDKKKEMQEYLTGLKGFIEQYTLPTAGKIVDFMMVAKPNGPDANGMFMLSGNNVVVSGDNLSLWVNPWTKHITHLQVNSTYSGDPVQLTATFALVPNSGLNYVSFAELTSPNKNLSVQVQNYNYGRLGY